MGGRARPTGRPVREREFHAWLARHLWAGHNGLLPLGDDAAALRPPPGQVAVVSTDALVEGTHFLPESPPELVGAAATAVSLSDVAAKGATPVAVVIALLIPPGTPRRWAEGVLRGAEAMARRHGAHVVGGDTKPSPVRSLVSTVVGWGTPGRLVPRSGARPGDRLVTTGDVGRGGLAAWTLNRTPRNRARALAGMLDVRPRVREGIALARYAHAMLDTSDGLADSARLLAEASRVRVVVEEERIPFASPVRRRFPAGAARRTVALFGGDYELFAALPPHAVPRASAAVARVGGRLTVVGRVERGRGAWLAHANGLRAMPPAGWQPFERARFRTPT